MDSIIRANHQLWKTLFTFFYPFTDHTFVIIGTVGIFVAFIPFLIPNWRKWEKGRLGIQDMIFAISIHEMLSQLPLIHKRLHTMLSTVSNVIFYSDTYREAFSVMSGIHPQRESTIVYALYQIPYKDLPKWEAVEPTMIYEKTAAVFRQTRGFLFGYLDSPVSWIEIFVLILLLGFTGIQCFCFWKKQEKKNTILSILQFMILLGSFWMKRGCVLFLVTVLFCKTLFYSISKDIQKTS